MSATGRLLRLVFLCVLCTISMAECEFNTPELGSLDSSVREGETRTLVGETTGIEKIIWTVNGENVTCTDEAATYAMTLIQSFEGLPEDSNLQKGAISGDLEYFRLDVVGVERILEKGKCLMRDPSDDRVETLIEGSYNPANFVFTVLSCSNIGAPSSAEIFYASKDVVAGSVTCKNGDQMQKVFEFSGLALH